jgi:APA family basic amino acid/polyamine antiporter
MQTGKLMAHELTRNFFLIYLGIGFVLYFAYGMWNSKLGKGEIVTGHEPQPDLGATGVQRDDTNN